jgi:DNA-binding response OmpR family regulator
MPDATKMRIAIVDDDPAARNYLDHVLVDRGYLCTQFSGGREALQALGRDTFDMLIVDWNMPGVTGIEIVEWARKNVTTPLPIIILTSRSDEFDIVRGLESGADDFIVKPETAGVIGARVSALLRRAAAVRPVARVHVFGDYTFDTSASAVRMGTDEIALTSKEFALALAFFQNQHRALSRSYILETIWNSVADLPTRTLDVHVSRIRSKLNLGRESGFRLHTIFGFGYRLESYEEA